MNRLILVGVVLVIGLIVLFSFVRVTRIDPGYVGIKVDLVGTDRTVDNADVVVGRVFYQPWTTDIIRYPTSIQRIEWYGEEALGFSTSEGVRLKADFAVSIAADPDRVPELYMKFRRRLDELVDTRVRDAVNNCLNRASEQLTVDNVIGTGKSTFVAAAETCVKAELEPEGFIVDDLSLTSDVVPPQEIQARINEKIQAQQQAIAAENRVRQTEAEARQRIAEAEGIRQAGVLEAQGQAEQIRIIQEQLAHSPQYLEYLQIQQWDGVMPTVLGGDSGFDILVNR